MLNKHRVACSRDAFKFSNFKSLGLRESLRLSFADALRGLVQHNRSSSSEQGGVGITIPDRGPVGWLGPQATKKKLEPQKFRPKTA